MTGVVIFTAGRDDAYEDYQRSVRDGIERSELEPHLSDEVATTVGTTEEKNVRVWGTTVEPQWRKIEQGDIVLVYREGTFISRARVVDTHENLALADHLWNRVGNPWDEDNPWKYLVFVDQFEEVDVPTGEFNSLIGYEPEFIPQGFMRVADKRIAGLLEDYDSVENALADLTGTGERVHEIEPDENEELEESALDRLKQDLIEASEEGSRSQDFEQLVADAFSRLGCTARWIEGGGDTDVEITYPVHTVVEAKSRSSSDGIRNINATGMVSHRNQRGADHALVVGRYFPPRAIEDAERNGITTLTTDHLIALLELHSTYAVPPEQIFHQLREPGAFQENRLDVLQESVDERINAFESLLSVLKGVEKSSDPVTARELRYILLGMTDPEELPEQELVAHSLQFLSHPVFGILEERENGYTLTTNYENAADVLRSLTGLHDEITEGIDTN